jgi:hypothetical protein
MFACPSDPVPETDPIVLIIKLRPRTALTIYRMSTTILSLFSAVNIALAPNAVKVLQHISVYHALRALGRTYEKLSLSNSRGQGLGSLFHRSKKHYNYAALRVHRAKV